MKHARMQRQLALPLAQKQEARKVALCGFCGKEFEQYRSTNKFCSEECQIKNRRQQTRIYPIVRKCKQCGKPFQIRTQADANRRYCSKKCSKRAHEKQVMDWKAENPNKHREYNQVRKIKNPGVWVGKFRDERRKAIALLGGKCIVCGVTNPNWLHIDYIPGTRNSRHRHPRHLAYIRKHLGEFRILCANHHYELTLTRKIEGTDITQ